jgi:4-diphosphocytidyl-2-C-methyl-D-erythritol kinase
VNLFLEVLGRRTDGYHEISTLMVAITHYDTLEFKEESAGIIRIESDTPSFSTGPDNLICQAAETLAKHAGCRRGARIFVRKRIPLAAGLGGGSSDAAATLSGLNQLWRLGLTGPELHSMAADLGSDVPFFLSGSAAWCSGRGEQVRPIKLDFSFWLVLVCPGEKLATRDVYRALQVPNKVVPADGMEKAIRQGDVTMIGRSLYNRLQPVAEQLCPKVARVRQRLEAFQPLGCLMSGSGSAVFALCRDRPQAVSIANAMFSRTESGPESSVFMVRSCS